MRRPDGVRRQSAVPAAVHRSRAATRARHADDPAAPRIAFLMLIARSIALFILAAVAEIGGAWLIWQGVREHRGLVWIGAGVIALGLYGFVATLQPDANFGRILAAYGDEDAAVRGKDPPEVGVRLQGGDEPVQTESDDAGADPDQPAMLPDPLPDQPGATYLGNRGEDEQCDRAGDEHEEGYPRRRRVVGVPGSGSGTRAVNGSGHCGLPAHTIRSSHPASMARRNDSRMIVRSVIFCSISLSLASARRRSPSSVGP